MKPLNVRFDETVFDSIIEISDRSGASKSDIARAAMQIGLITLSESTDKQVFAKINIAKLRVMFGGDQEAIDEMLESNFDTGK